MGMMQIFRDWRHRGQILGELRRLRDRERQDLIVSPKNPLLRAGEALDSGDLAAANEYWDAASLDLKDYVLASKRSIWVLLKLGRLKELEQLMQEGLRRWPSNTQYMSGLAQMYEAREDFHNAAKWWRKACRSSAGDAAAFVRGGACLRRIGCAEEAESLLSRGVKYYPEEKDLWVILARIYEERKDWPSALRYWDHVGRTMRHVSGIVGAARICQAMGHLDEAIERLEQAVKDGYRDKDLYLALAPALERASAIERAAQIWRSLRMTAPTERLAYESEARCLRIMGKAAEADVILSQADRREADHGQV